MLENEVWRKSRELAKAKGRRRSRRLKMVDEKDPSLTLVPITWTSYTAYRRSTRGVKIKIFLQVFRKRGDKKPLESLQIHHGKTRVFHAHNHAVRGLHRRPIPEEIKIYCYRPGAWEAVL